MTQFNPAPRMRANLKRVRATCMGWVIADTRHAITVSEDGQAPVHYFPPDDVEFGWLAASGEQSRCELKGDAALYDVQVRGQTIANAAWIYEKPASPILALRSYVAFDAAKIEVRELAVGEAVYPGHSPAAEAWDLAS